MIHAIPLTTRLRENDRAALETHFLSLSREDRRLRFGSSMGDDALKAYVRRIDFGRDGIFAAHDDMRLIAVVHVASGDDSAELGLSVLPAVRGQGLGSALFSRAVPHLRNRGIREVFVHCISENAPMLHLARKHRMRPVFNGAEADARLVLEPATAQSLFSEWLDDHYAMSMQTVRQTARFSRAVLGLPT